MFIDVDSHSGPLTKIVKSYESMYPFLRYMSPFCFLSRILHEMRPRPVRTHPGWPCPDKATPMKGHAHEGHAHEGHVQTEKPR